MIVKGAVHDIHSARWLMGDDVAVVYASHITDGPERPESARLVLLQLTFRCGGLATIEVDVDSNYGYEVAVEVSGERGTLGTPSLTSPILRKDGTASRAVEVDWLERFETAYLLEAEAWCAPCSMERRPARRCGTATPLCALQTRRRGRSTLGKPRRCRMSHGLASTTPGSNLEGSLWSASG